MCNFPFFSILKESRKETEQQKVKQDELSNVNTKMQEEHKMNLEKDSKMSLLRQKFQVQTVFIDRYWTWLWFKPNDQ